MKQFASVLLKLQQSLLKLHIRSGASLFNFSYSRCNLLLFRLLPFLKAIKSQVSSFVFSGEHGIGEGKKGYLKEQISSEALDLMKLLKKALDPHQILNPHKIFDLDETEDLK